MGVTETQSTMVIITLESVHFKCNMKKSRRKNKKKKKKKIGLPKKCRARDGQRSLQCSNLMKNSSKYDKTSSMPRYNVYKNVLASVILYQMVRVDERTFTHAGWVKDREPKHVDRSQCVSVRWFCMVSDQC